MNALEPQSAQHWIKFLESKDLSSSNKNLYFEKESNSVTFSDTNRKIADYAKISEEINKELNDLPANKKYSLKSLFGKNITLINSKIESHNAMVNSINRCYWIFSYVFGFFIDMTLYKSVSPMDVFEYSSTHLEQIAPYEESDPELFYKPFIEVNGNTYLIRFRYMREEIS